MQISAELNESLLVLYNKSRINNWTGNDDSIILAY